MKRGSWFVVTPGGTPCLYSNEAKPLWSKNRDVAIANALNDTNGMYESWAQMEERGYTLERAEEAP